MRFEHEILNWFEKVSAIPRCSGNEAAISQWLMNWAKENHFEVKTDKTQNLLLKVPASPGYENAPIVVIQGHLDMVCEKTPDSNHDFTKDPINLIYDDEWLTADKTSLGADNGIAIAMAMALVMDKEVSHPPLELLFTVNEEIGLVGAAGLEAGFFEGKILLNLDSEEEGHFTIGCAGGLNTHLSVPIQWAEVPSHFQLMKINTGGMTGGHSGVDIHIERANAIKVLTQTLFFVKQQVDIQLVKIHGGTAHNAIPRDAEAFVFVPYNQIETVKTLVQEVETILRYEYKNTDSGLFIKVDASSEHFDQVTTSENTQKLIDFLMGLPHGVAAMSTLGLVETSNNLAQVRVENGHLVVLTSQRSSVESRLEALTHQIEAVARLAGGKVYNGNRYPAWQPNMDSPLLLKSCEIYERLFEAQKPVVKVIHAGLECGIIGNKVPGIDMLSFGPTIKSPHSPDEKIHLASVGRVGAFLVALLKECR